MIHIFRHRSPGRLSAILVLAFVLTGCVPANQASNAQPVPAPISTAQIAATVTAVVTEPPTPDPTPAYDPFTDEQPISQTPFIIPPTIQYLTSASAQVLFELETAQPGTVIFRPVNSEAVASNHNIIPLDPKSARHSLLLPDLAASARYELLVRLGDGSLETLEDVRFGEERWGPQTFRTPPYEATVRFAVIGDTGFGDPATVRLAEQIASQSPDFVLHLGDVVYRAEEQSSPSEAYALKYYIPFRDVLRQAPIYPALGNHDANDRPAFVDGQPFYYRAFAPILAGVTQFPPPEYQDLRKWYAFAVGDVQFLSLDTQVLFGDPGRAEQRAWLEERLADSRFAYTIPFTHVPAFSNTFHRGDAQVVRSWSGLFEQHRVPLVLSGHDHAYARFVSGSVNYIVSGGGSQSLYAFEESDPANQFFASQSHFLLVELTPQHITVRAIAANDSLIEEITVPVLQ